jgi:hypothetical protein
MMLQDVLFVTYRCCSFDFGHLYSLVGLQNLRKKKKGRKNCRTKYLYAKKKNCEIDVSTFFFFCGGLSKNRDVLYDVY